MTYCSSCGAELKPDTRFCQGCGQPLEAPLAKGAEIVPAQAAPGPAVQQTVYVQQQAPVGAPGIGVAGFVLSLLGISLPGLVLSWVGYAKAKREGLPSGLCLAGIIIGAVGLVITIIVYAVLSAAVSSVHTYYGG